MAYFLGIDPGYSGFFAIVYRDQVKEFLVKLVAMPETPHDVVDIMRTLASEFSFTRCMVESVHSFPKQGVSSTFKFGMQFGIIQGVMAALGIPYELVSPQKWQKIFGLKGGDKKLAYATAERLFGVAIKPMRAADAALIALFCARTRGG